MDNENKVFTGFTHEVPDVVACEQTNKKVVIGTTGMEQTNVDTIECK